MKIQKGERWLVCGPTGCGKTTLSKELAIEYVKKLQNHRLYVLNSKYGDDFKEWGGNFPTNGKKPKALKGNERLQIWSPLHRINEEIEGWLDRILNDGPCVLYIDELIHLMYKRTDFSMKYEEIMKVGRSKGVSVIANTQNLVKLPYTTITQSTHLVRFRLLSPYERRLSQMLLQSEEKLKEPNKYGFYYGNMTDMSVPKLYDHYSKFIKELK